MDISLSPVGDQPTLVAAINILLKSRGHNLGSLKQKTLVHQSGLTAASTALSLASRLLSSCDECDIEWLTGQQLLPPLPTLLLSSCDGYDIE